MSAVGSDSPDRFRVKYGAMASASTLSYASSKGSFTSEMQVLAACEASTRVKRPVSRYTDSQIPKISTDLRAEYRHAPSRC
jgi:hypothetical protein